MSRIRITDDGCWEWTGGKSDRGYGHFQLDGRTRSTHRVAYTLFVGAIPKGLTIDHLCRNKLCLNPDHLEAVTNAENIRRGLTKTHCIRGHDLSLARITGKGKRLCWDCEVERRQNQKARRDAA